MLRRCHRFVIISRHEYPMAQYSLTYGDDGIGQPKQIDFLADDPSRALHLAHREANGRPAELWRDGRPLCTIKRVGTAPDYWMIGPAHSA